MPHLEVSGAVRHIYIYICVCVIRRLKVKDRRGYSHLKEETLDRTMWRNRFGGGFGPVVKTEH